MNELKSSGFLPTNASPFSPLSLLSSGLNWRFEPKKFLCVKPINPPLRLNSIEKTEFEKQVDELSLEGKPEFLIPINIHVYEDKFWNYIVTKDVGQIRDFTIYG